jgi:zinc protease
MKRISIVLFLTSVFPIVSCVPAGDAEFSVDYECYELANGLNVVLHIDRSDPIAAVAMAFHVGSSKEVEGRTGFAHLFEHLFFLDSENLGPGGLDRLMNRVGSSANGFTTRDQTNYFEVVPNDALEKAIWAEADKLGYFINTVTEGVVGKEKQVVKNEKRQRVDNAPYGHNNFVLDNALYPEGHPYRWQVIGSLDDLEAAELADVREFHKRWYGPNNVTLAVAGDIDVEQTKAWIERYFGEIPRREMPAMPEPSSVQLTEDVRLFHEDNFANLPQLSLVWPTVPLYHPDSYPLDMLADLLTDGKMTPFYKVIVKEDKLAPRAIGFHNTQELAGRFGLQVRAFPDTDLDAVYASVEKAFARFEETGVPEDELRRVKAGYETGFYNGLSSTIGKAFQLAQYNMLAGDPGFVTEDIERALAVTEADVMRVYETYIKGKAHVASSFVPKGQLSLVLEDSQRAEVVEEPIVAGQGEFEFAGRGEVPTTPSSFDRSVEPPLGDPPILRAPTVWSQSLPSGLGVLGIEDAEIPLVRFEIRMKGGLLLDDPNHVGTANLLAETMTQGTTRRTPGELEQAIQLLGASINVGAGRETFVISGSTLARNYAETMALVEEILLEPRWDEEEFALARERVQNRLRQQEASPNAVATNVFNRLLYGYTALGLNSLGTLESVDSMTIDNLKEYYERALSPSIATFHVVGSVSQPDVITSLAGIADRWASRDVTFPDVPASSEDAAGLYFVDIPGSSQSVLRIGYLALAENDPDYYPATVMNFRFGGGGFASDLTQVLREGKGYTYGIGSGFNGSDLPGAFQIGSSVRSNVTYESLELIRKMIAAHGPTFDAEDLEATTGFLLKSNARRFETLGAKLGVLADMSAYGFAADYVLQREAIVRDMTEDRIRELATQYLDGTRMIWLVVGDAETQLERLGSLGMGEPTSVNREGEVYFAGD